MSDTRRITDSSVMGTEAVPSVLIKMAFPLMCSMLVQALYNVVDSVYVSMVSEDCLTALSLAFPVQNILIGLGTGTGVGIITLISRSLGCGDNKRANHVAGNAIFLAVCCWLLMLVFGIFWAKPFIWSQTDSEAIRSYGDRYLMTVCIGSIFAYFEICCEKLLQSTSLTKLSMITQMVGAVTNIILDPFFIFGWCGLPAMDTLGAAIATVIGQAVGAVVGVVLLLRRNRELRISARDLIPDGGIISATYRIGFPSILMMVVSSFTTYVMNLILIGFSSTAVAVYGGYFKIQSMFFMPVFGLNSAVVPIIGYNFGARKKARIYETVKVGVMYAAVLMVIGMIVLEAFPGFIFAKVFSASEAMLLIGVPALRIIAIHFPIASFNIVAGSAFQALDRSVFSFITSLMRQVFALLPVAYLLSLTGNVNNVWWCFPIAEVVSTICTVIFLKLTFGNMERRLAEPVE